MERLRSGVAPSFDSGERPDLTLYRAIADADNPTQLSEGAEATYALGEMPQPTWKEGANSAWSFAYENLPKTDASGNPYTYWVTEVDDSAPGFIASGDDEPSAPVSETSSGQTNAEITNTATRFKLDKVNDFAGDNGQPESLDGVEFAVVSPDKKTVYAVWQRDESGNESSWVWRQGADVNEVWPGGIGSGNADTDSGTAVAGDGNAGSIIGVPVGEYRIVESGPSPAYHAVAEDVFVAIKQDGTVVVHDGNGTAITDEGTVTTHSAGVVTVSVVDDVFRGHVKIEKTIYDETSVKPGEAGEPLENAKFDLYRVSNGSNVMAAAGITTDANGEWTSANSDVAFTDDFIESLGDAGKYFTKSNNGSQDTGTGTLANGLPAGEYYFKEIDAGSEAQLAADRYFTISGPTAQNPQGDHEKTVVVTIENQKFAAAAQIAKFDSINGAPVKDAKFKLEYWEGVNTIPPEC